MFILFTLQFYGPVNIVKVISSRSVNLLTYLSWAGFGLLAVTQYLCTYFSQYLTITLFESAEEG